MVGTCRSMSRLLSLTNCYSHFDILFQPSIGVRFRKCIILLGYTPFCLFITARLYLTWDGWIRVWQPDDPLAARTSGIDETPKRNTTTHSVSLQNLIILSRVHLRISSFPSFSDYPYPQYKKTRLRCRNVVDLVDLFYSESETELNDSLKWEWLE